MNAVKLQNGGLIHSMSSVAGRERCEVTGHASE